MTCHPDTGGIDRGRFRIQWQTEYNKLRSNPYSSVGLVSDRRGRGGEHTKRTSDSLSVAALTSDHRPDDVPITIGCAIVDIVSIGPFLMVYMKRTQSRGDGRFMDETHRSLVGSSH